MQTKVQNLLHIAKSTNTPCVWYSTGWIGHLFSVLLHIGLGEVMLGWIAKIYSNLTAQGKGNGVLSDPFPIQNWTRQGCPLSPLLFALSLEPFLPTDRSNPDIQGLPIGNAQYKISSDANDLFFMLTNPAILLSNFLKEFDIYRMLSNLKIYFSKSGAMAIALSPHTLPTVHSNFRLKWTMTALNYLGT